MYTVRRTGIVRAGKYKMPARPGLSLKSVRRAVSTFRRSSLAVVPRGPRCELLVCWSLDQRDSAHTMSVRTGSSWRR